VVVRKRRVRIHFVDRVTTIEGILVSRTRADLLLDAAELIEAADSRHTLDGRIAVPRSQVLFSQILN
jgi:hypothetical protein